MTDAPVDRSDMIEVLAAVRVLPVITVRDLDHAVPIARAVAAGGLPTIEITLRTRVALDAIRRVVSEVPGVTVGAGSVMNAANAEAAIRAGARYLVSPGFDDGVLDVAQSHGIRAIPGIATATELQRASNAGVDVVKVFPAAVAGGPALLRSFASVWPAMRFVPTGGIDAASAGDYLALPAVVAVGGSWMVPDDAVAAGDWPDVATAVAAAAQLAEEHA